jgi:hypothetical protein
LRAPLAPALLLLLATGCEPATLSELQEDFFTPTCAVEGCHGDFLAGRDLNLSDGISYGATVDVAAQEPGYTLVVPGDPDSSLLYLVLLGPIFGDGEDQTQTLGQMPPRVGSDPGMTQQQLSAVRSWIADGAQDN